MDNMITDGMDTVFFVVKVNGVEKSTRFTDRMMAEMAIKDLPTDQQMLAEVQTITNDGKQLLLG